MIVHLTVNASLLNSVQSFQGAVYGIHSAGKILPLVEWGGIFGPLLFHGLFGVWIAKNAKLNTNHYKYVSNRRYSWQRWTGVIALVYLFLHILHLHGWFHFEPYLAVIQPLGLGSFKPYNAASTLAIAMNQFGGVVWPPIYLIGVLCCVYHLANGIWTAGITWGIWISPTAQARASKVCTAFGLGLGFVGMVAWWAAVSPGDNEIEVAKKIEDRMYRVGVEAGYVPLMEEKRSQPDVVAEEFEAKGFVEYEAMEHSEETEELADSQE
ncbi:Succinate dehydrogenase cytochrome b558 subunit [Planctomycetes bacterium CA13]|uniref:Succinate dehydrogenase cytochrome b558 subunit n=2 Tax=Novipirellula herctigrandis TaxID=2527986 RepID=A0A5C5Z8Q4_9BACT|nr:Succinate dehydrogenase cytochrome b558 subunit [Planctomycetes bacterium CA13]